MLAHKSFFWAILPQERRADPRRLTRDAELLRLRVSSTSERAMLPSLLRRRCILEKRPPPLPRPDDLPVELTLARRDDVSDPAVDDRRDDPAEYSDRPEMRFPAMATASAVS